MPVRFLNWGAFGPYGGVISGTQTVDTGGVNVAVTVDGTTEGDIGTTIDIQAFVAASDPFPGDSHLKLFGDGIEPAGTPAGVNDVSTTTFEFSSADTLFGDSVQNVTFRINDIDGAAVNDTDGGPAEPFQDIVTIRAFDEDGNPVPVSLTAGSAITLNGATAEGAGDTLQTDPSSSLLVNIAGPVSRIEIDYDNGAGGENNVVVSDVYFETTDNDNEAPDAVDDTVSTDIGDPVVIPVLGNDSDPEGDPLTVTSTTDPSNGSITVNTDGTITYTPDPGFTGDDSFTYTIDDGNGGTDTATVTVTVDPNSAPDAVDDSQTTGFETPTTIAVLGNDTDPEGDPLSVTGTTDPSNGSVTVNADGTITYTPDAGFSGDDSFTYTIDDGNGGVDTATVTVTVDPDPNTAPDAVDDAQSTTVNTATTIPVLGNDTDPEGDTLTVVPGSVTDPANGSVTLNGDGTITYTPDTGFTGTDTFEYTIDDGNGGSDTATVTVTVNDDPNLPPVATDDSAQALPEEEIVIPVLDNDSDPDGDPLTIIAVSDPPNGVAFPSTDGSSITYIPDPDFTGTDTFTYTIQDPSGATSTATVTVDVGEGRIDTDVFPVDPSLQPLDPLDGLDEDPDPTDDLDSVEGTTGADFIQTGDDADTIIAFDGDDTIRPGIDDDIVEGRGGDDLIIDVQGADTIGGGSGDDTINAGVDTFSDYAGDDTFFGPGALGDILGFDADPNQDDGRDSVTGGVGNDLIFTGDDRDTIDGGADDDTINAGIDDDSIFGASGNDEIIGGHGSDTADGGQGDDFIDTSNLDALELIDDNGADSDAVPENDRDSVIGGIGNDTIITGDDADTIEGNGGNDQINSGIDDDSVLGQGGIDTIFSGQGSDFVDGGDGGDLINTDNLGERTLTDDVDTFVNDDRDTVLGGAGDDTISTGDDADSVDGGIGNDEINTGIDDDTVDGGTGADTITTSHGSDSVLGGDGNDLIDAGNLEDRTEVDETDTAPDDDRDFVDGGIGNDTIATGDDADTILGGDGADLINAGIDDDSVDGGIGDDTIVGDHGSDTILGGDGDDSVTAGLPNDPALIDALDANPDNDRDSVDGGAGNDVLLGGDDDDTLIGGTGDDTLDGGIDEDSLLGGDGNDELIGGQGDDTLAGEADDDTISGGDGDDQISMGSGDDSTDGGDGDDIITDGGGNDTIQGGGGDDNIIAGDPNFAPELLDAVDVDPDNDRDLVDGGEGNDTLIGGDDDDTLNGGSGNDLVDGGIDEDSLDGGAGDDTVLGGQGTDIIFGGAGDDELRGGTESDTIDGGTGNDTIFGGADADEITGGADRDLIVVGSAEDGRDDTIDGGSEGDDFDVLDLTGIGVRGEDWRIVNERPDSNGNGIDGTIQTLNADGEFVDLFDFTEIEEIVPCFTPGTSIATPTGERLVEDLREGDRVITRDNGLQEIRWIGQKELTGHQLARMPHLRPILIQAGSLGPNLPEQDMLVSPNHRVLVSNDKTALYFEEREVLVSAKHLTGLEGVDEVGTLGVNYVHFMFDQHEVVLSNGAWTESFQPGDYTMSGMGNAQRNEIFELFPELKTREGLEDYAAARRSLKKHEAKILSMK